MDGKLYSFTAAVMIWLGSNPSTSLMCYVISTELKWPEGEGWREGDVQREAVIQRARIVHLPSGHLTQWEISLSAEAPFLRILAATSFKTTVSLLNNHLCAYVDELEIHPSFLVCSFPSLPDLPPYKSAFQLSLAAVSKLRRKPKKCASTAPPILIPAASG